MVNRCTVQLASHGAKRIKEVLLRGLLRGLGALRRLGLRDYSRCPHLLGELLLGLGVLHLDGELDHLTGLSCQHRDTLDVVLRTEKFLIQLHILECYRLLVLCDIFPERPYRHPDWIAANLATHLKEIVRLLVEGCRNNLDEELVLVWEVDDITVTEFESATLTVTALGVTFVSLHRCESE